jgi:hypothetical protein
MGGYWRKVAKRAGKEAFVAIFTSPEKAVISLLLQLIAGLLIFIALGQAEVKVEVRVLAAFAPLLAWPMMFLWKLIAVPAAIYGEQRAEEDNERKGQFFYLCDLYVNEVAPDNGNLIHRGLALPPQDWVNWKLEELGFSWRVRYTQGVQYVTEDVAAISTREPA